MPQPHALRPVPAASLDRLAAWARRKPCVALLGEVSSGKSALLNRLLGQDLLPTRVTATELPPVRVSHGPQEAYWVDHDGQRHPLPLGGLHAVPRSARVVRLFSLSPVLETCDLLDTPGLSDPNLEGEPWRIAVGQASLVLWCTPATQAWRESERSFWLSLPQRLRARSLLVATRADGLTGPGDRDKVERRLFKEGAGLFGGVALVSNRDADQWALHGGAHLVARLDASLAGVRADRAALLERYRPLEAAHQPDPGLWAQPTAPTSPAVPTAEDEADRALEALILAANEPEDAERPATKAPATDPLDAALDALLRDANAPETHAADSVLPFGDQPLPREVQVWREIVARSAVDPSHRPILAMIDQLLSELACDDGQAEVADARPTHSGNRYRVA